MVKVYKKYKIYNQTNENIHNNVFITKLKKKKWKFLVKLNKKNISLKKPIILKHLYKERLKERQKLKTFYGVLTTKRLKTLYQNIKNRHKSFIIENLLNKLEQQLCLILWHTRMFASIFEIKQYISHGFIKINDKKITNSNIFIKPGDIIFISKKIQKFSNDNIILPSYLEWNKNVNILTLIKKPEKNDRQHTFIFNPVLIFDYLKNK